MFRLGKSIKLKNKLVVPEAGRKVKWGVNANEYDISLGGVMVASFCEYTKSY